MARSTILGNLAKMLRVREGIDQGLSVTKACKAAGTSSGSYRKWQERYATLGTPTAVIPLSDRGVFRFSRDGRFLFVLDDEGGPRFTRIATASGEQQTHHVEVQRGPYDYPSIMAAGATPDGERVLMVINDGALKWWTPETDDVTDHTFHLRDRGCEIDSRSSSGVRRWSAVSFSWDLGWLAYWQTLESENILHILNIEDGEERMVYSVGDVSIWPAIAFHPTRPLIGLMGANSLVTILNHASGEALVEEGPQVHSISFSVGDTILSDDWYGRTVVFNYQNNETHKLGKGWDSRGSQSPHFLTATSSDVHLRSITDPERDRVLSFDEIIEIGLSVDGQHFVVRGTDHVGLWSIDALLA